MMRIFAVAALAVSLAACGDKVNDNLVSPTPAVGAGTYALRTIDGNGLPFTYPGPDGLTLVTITGQLGADGSYHTASVYSNERVGTDAGTYQVNGTDIKITTVEGEVYAGTLSGGVLTIPAGDGHTYVFQQY